MFSHYYLFKYEQKTRSWAKQSLFMKYLIQNLKYWRFFCYVGVCINAKGRHDGSKAAS